MTWVVQRVIWGNTISDLESYRISNSKKKKLLKSVYEQRN